MTASFPTDIVLKQARAHIDAALDATSDQAILDYPGEAPFWFDQLDRGGHIAHALSMLSYANGIGRMADRAASMVGNVSALEQLPEKFTFEQAREALGMTGPGKGRSLHRLLLNQGFVAVPNGAGEYWCRAS